MKVKRDFESIILLSDHLPLVVGLPIVQSNTDERLNEFEHKLLEFISDKFFFETSYRVAFITTDIKTKIEVISDFLKRKYSWFEFLIDEDRIEYQDNVINFFTPTEEFQIVYNYDYDYLIQFEEVLDYETFEVLSAISKRKIITTFDHPNSIYYDTEDTYRQIYISDYSLEIDMYLNNNHLKLKNNEERYRRGNFDGVTKDNF